jgi:tRNA (guanine37-N1)-methyltransferase
VAGLKRIDVITLFPEWIDGLKHLGVTGRAMADGRIELHCWNPRDFTDDVHRSVDDRPYGGGPGMVMRPEPLARCIEAVLLQG